MESLSTEILQKIIGDLPVYERIRVERVCKRWKNVSTERVWRDVQVLYLIDPGHGTSSLFHRYRDSLENLGKFLAMADNILYIDVNELGIIQSLVSRAGQHVKKFILDSIINDRRTKPMLSIIAAHCHNIESIQLIGIGNSAVIVFLRLLKVNKKLRSITCLEANNIIGILPLRNWNSLIIAGSRCLQNNRDEKRMATLIENSPSLERCDFEYWSPNILTAISKCENLKALAFPPWDEKAAYDLMMNTSLLNGLTRLNVDGAEDKNHLIIDLLRHCVNLESLFLFYAGEQFPVEVEQTVLALPKLEFLELNAPSVTDEILSRLRKFRFLQLHNFSKFITENGIFKMIMNSECLEKLRLPKNKVSTELFKRLAQIAGERRKILEIEVSTDIYVEALTICKGTKVHIIEKRPEIL